MCFEHPGKQIEYICSTDQSLLCAHCILKPKYRSQLFKIINYKKKDVELVSKKMQEVTLRQVKLIEGTLKNLHGQIAVAPGIMKMHTRIVARLMSMDDLLALDHAHLAVIQALTAVRVYLRVLQHKLANSCSIRIIFSFLARDKLLACQSLSKIVYLEHIPSVIETVKIQPNGFDTSNIVSSDQMATIVKSVCPGA